MLKLKCPNEFAQKAAIFYLISIQWRTKYIKILHIQYIQIERKKSQSNLKRKGGKILIVILVSFIMKIEIASALA